MVVRYILGYLLLLFCCSSCSSQVPLRVKRNFTFCYNSATNYSNSKIQVTGFYVSVELFERPHYEIETGKRLGSTLDTIYTNMLFFPNGLIVTGFTGLNCGNCDIERNTQFLKNVSQNKQPETSVFYGYNWGIYIITGDTVKVQVVNSQPWPNPYWYLFEHWYFINADGTLQPIYSKNLIDNKILNEKPIKPIYKFIETNIQLPSDTWLKKEEWFWCDLEEFRKWKMEKEK